MSTLTRSRLLGPAPLWVLLLAGPVAWILRLLISYMGIALACAEGFVGPELFGFPVLSFVMLGIGVFFTLVCLAAGVLSWQAWRQSRAEAAMGVDEAINRSGALAAMAMFLNAFFVVTTGAETAAIFFLRPCL